CTARRLVAGVVFIPLLAYVFPPFLALDLPYVLCLAFWVGVMSLALVAVWGTRRLLSANTILSQPLPGDFVFAALILALFTPLLWLLAWLLFTLDGHDAPDLLNVANYAVLLAAGLVLVRRGGGVSSEHATPPRLTRRLPETFRGRIYRLTVRDHNVDVVTSEGLFTIRHRFKDAIDDMEPIAGHRAHRSHWIADAAVSGVQRVDGKIWLRLVNGDLVPVSRKYKPMLEQDGLI
ncbi:MAG: LytTR family DNA-binding domain-containing protein, partial [Pseudomonadota bacterium]